MSNTAVLGSALPHSSVENNAETGNPLRSSFFGSLAAGALKLGVGIAPAAEMLHHIFALTAEKEVYSGYAYRVDESGNIAGSMHARLIGETSSEEKYGTLKDPTARILTNSEEGYRDGRFYLLSLESVWESATWTGRMVFSQRELTQEQVTSIIAKGPLAPTKHDYMGNIYKADNRLWPEFYGLLEK